MVKIQSKISDKIRDKIKLEKVKPIPKWHFVLQHGFLWVLLVILLLTGAVALGLSHLQLTDVEWDLRPMMGMGPVNMFVMVFPYFWAVVFAVVAALAYFNFMATPKGYRYPQYQIVLFGLLLVILTGAIVRYGGFAQNFHDRIEMGAPGFERWLEHGKEQIYNMPDQGLIFGIVEEVNENTLLVRGLDGHKWIVDIQGVDLPAGKKIEMGQKLKVIGEKINENEFKARELRPWRKGDPLQFGKKMKDQLMGKFEKTNGGAG